MKKLLALILSAALILTISAPVLAMEMWPGYPGPDELEPIDTLPNPFKFWKVENDPDGDGYVSSPEEWPARKEEIRDLFQHYWYGYKWPTAAEDVRGGAVPNMVDNNQSFQVAYNNQNYNASLNLYRAFYELVAKVESEGVSVEVEGVPVQFGPPVEGGPSAEALAVAAFNAGYMYSATITVGGFNWGGMIWGGTQVPVNKALVEILGEDLEYDLSNLPAEKKQQGYNNTIYIKNPELGTEASFNITVTTPSEQQLIDNWGSADVQVPVVLGPGVFAQATLLANGYATATYSTGSIYPDSEGGSGYGADRRAGVYTKLYPFDAEVYEYSSGFQMACAWAVSQMITAFENKAVDENGEDLDVTFGELLGVDPTRTAVTGHSRNGQGSIVSAAFDDRISIALPSEPACGSFRYKVEGKIFNFNTDYYPAANRVYGITGPASNGLGGTWFSGRADIFKFDFPECDRELLLPMDPGEMIACIAPRPYYCVTGIHMHWQGNEGIASIVAAAAEVYDFIGTNEIEKNNIAVNARESSHAFYYTFDVPFALAILDREWKQKDAETGEYTDPVLHVRDLNPPTSFTSTNAQNITYPAKDYNYISEFNSYPFELSSYYTQWSSPNKYMLWTAQDSFLIEHDITITAHSDAPDVKLITPEGKVIDAASHDGEIFTFELAAEDNAYGRYELQTVGEEKDNRSVFFAAISVGDALRHGTTKGDEGEENRVLGFSSRLANNRQDPPVVVINGEPTDMNFTPNRTPPQETTLFGYGINFHDKLFIRIANEGWSNTTGTFGVKNLKFVTLPEYVFEFSMAKIYASAANSGKDGANRFTKAISWPVQKWNNGPAEDWPPIPYGAVERGIWNNAEAEEPGSGYEAVRATRSDGPAPWSTPFDAEITGIESHLYLDCMEIDINFSEPLDKGEYAFGFDTIDDWSTEWNYEGDQLIITVPLDAIDEGAEGANIIIFRLMDLDGNLIAAPIEDYVEFSDVLEARNSVSLSLEGNIAANFYLELAAYEGIDRIEITHSDPTKEAQTMVTDVYEPDFEENDIGDGFYLFEVEQAAPQMTDPITITIFGRYNEVLYTKSTSIREIAEDYIEYYEGKDEDIVELCTDLLTYGGYAQVWFDYKADDLANANYSADIDEVSAEDVAQYSVAWADPNAGDGIAYAGQVFSCRTNTVMRYYFTAPKGASAEDFEVDIYGAEITKSGNYIVVSISDIAAPELAMEMSFALTYNGEFVGTLTASPMAYVKSVLAANSNEDLVNLAKAIYLYGTAAKGFFIEQPM